jgi:hypothetical protein
MASSNSRCRSVRRTATAWPVSLPKSGILPVASTAPLALRMFIRSIRVPTSSTRGSSPSRSKTAMPFGCNANAAPTSVGRSARSTSVTRDAMRLSTALAARPPIPAPTISTWSTSSSSTCSNGHDASRSVSERQDEAEAAPEREGEEPSNRLSAEHSSKSGFSERALISCEITGD